MLIKKDKNGREIKAGDKVRATQDCSGSKKGEVYIVKEQGGSLCIVHCTCHSTWEKIGETMKNIWEVIVVDKKNDKILVREIVIDGDEKSACSKVSIAFATKLKDLVFNDLCYVTKNLGSYESKK